MINPRNIFSRSVAKITATNATFSALDEVREKIASLKARIEELQNSPQDLDASMLAVAQWLDRSATDAIDTLRFQHAVEPEWRRPELPFRIIRGSDLAVPDSSRACEVLLGLIVLIGRDRLLETIRGQVEDRMQGEAGVSAAERDRLIEETRLDLFAHEMAEEALVRRMRANGISAVRRRDIPGLVLLAADTDLPS